MKITDHFHSKEVFQLRYHSEMDAYQTIFDGEDLMNYYPTEKYISHSDSDKTLFDKIYQLVKKITIQSKWKQIQKLVNVDRIHLLDYGCGTGDFLEYGSQKGFVTYGFEPNKFARNQANKKGVTTIESLDEIPNQSLDVITLWHVLEHIPNYDELVQQLVSKLKTDGLLIIAVPNHKSYDAKHYGDYWAAWDVPRHLWHFSPASMFYIAKSHSLDFFKSKPMWFDAFYISMISEKYQKNKCSFFKGLFYGFLSNLKGIFTKNYSSHTYFFRKRSKF